MIPFGVIAVYCALGIWLGLLIVSFRRRSYRAFLLYGVALMLLLNVRYAIDGAGKSIAFFIGIYDVLHNFGASDPSTNEALATCAPNTQCSAWGDTFKYHPAWGVAFHQRFTDGNQTRVSLLNSHIFFTTAAFITMMIQLLNPGSGKHPRLHKWMGYVSFSTVTAGLLSACILAVEHKSVARYGGPLSTYGFWFMSFCVYACVVMGIVAVKKKDLQAHRKWMIRYAGSLWGSFWVFRTIELVLGPFLRSYDTASILVCIWASAPLGIIIAEFARKMRKIPAISIEPNPVANPGQP